MSKGKKKNNDLQSTTQKAQDRTTWTPQKSGVNLCAPEILVLFALFTDDIYFKLLLLGLPYVCDMYVASLIPEIKLFQNRWNKYSRFGRFDQSFIVKHWKNIPVKQTYFFPFMHTETTKNTGVISSDMF